ncbi:MAG: hypothetical protein KDA53_09755, partial [Hyphomonas sp.]|nr:hypothetical protein [Hyphomonas sp.]
MTPQQAARRAMILTSSYDLAVAALAMAVSNLVVWWSAEDRGAFPVESAAISVAVFTLSVAVGFGVLKIHTQVWRHIGWPD